jgi:hypothetical protein
MLSPALSEDCNRIDAVHGTPLPVEAESEQEFERRTR